MAGLYQFTLKSKEARGASDYNGIAVWLASDDDANLFKTNLESLFSADVVSIDVVISSDYSTPYPAGTNFMFRLDMIGPDERHTNQVLYDVEPDADVGALASGLIAAGILLPYGSMGAINKINVARFDIG